MNLPELGTIIIGTCGALILGMAGLIKVMILSKLEAIQAAVSALAKELHQVDVRLTKLEAEHHVRDCRFRGEDTHV